MRKAKTTKTIKKVKSKTKPKPKSSLKQVQEIKSSLVSAKSSPGPFGVISDTAPVPERSVIATMNRHSPSEIASRLEQTFVPQPLPKVAATKRINSVAKGLLVKIVEPPKKTKHLSTATVYAGHPVNGSSEEEIQAASHLITNVIKVPDSVKDQYAKNLRSLTSEITDFLLLEVAPYESALEAALSDAGESIQLITGVQHADFSLGRAEMLLKRIPELKTLDWVCERLDIAPDIRSLVLNEYMGIDRDKSKPTDLSRLIEALARSGKNEDRRRVPPATRQTTKRKSTRE